MSNTTPTSIRIVEGVAAHENVDPMDLEPPLHDVVDTDALDALFRTGDDSTATVEFTYCGTRVRVDDAGTIDISPTSPDSGGSAAIE